MTEPLQLTIFFKKLNDFLYFYEMNYPYRCLSKQRRRNVIKMFALWLGIIMNIKWGILSREHGTVIHYSHVLGRLWRAVCTPCTRNGLGLCLWAMSPLDRFSLLSTTWLLLPSKTSDLSLSGLQEGLPMLVKAADMRE